MPSDARGDPFGVGTGDDDRFYQSFGDDPSGSLNDPATEMFAWVLEESGDAEDWVLDEVVHDEALTELIVSDETALAVPDEVDPRADNPYYEQSDPSDRDPEQSAESFDPSNDACKEPEDPLADVTGPSSSSLDDDSPPLEVEPIDPAPAPPPLVVEPYPGDDDDDDSWGD